MAAAAAALPQAQAEYEAMEAFLSSEDAAALLQHGNA
jgi:hypothetical protein